MLGTSSHAWKVNFCKFTNETRNGMEDSSRHDGFEVPSGDQWRICAAAVRTGAGLRRDPAGRERPAVSLRKFRSSACFPEPAALDGVENEGAVAIRDMFAQSACERRARKQWGLVDDIAPPAKFPELVRTHAEARRPAR